MVFNNAIHYRETQSAPAGAHLLLRIIRLKNLSDISRVDSDSGIFYAENHVIPRLNLVMASPKRF